jgi:hypothetical protein
MAVADFCSPIGTPLGAPSQWQAGRSPGVRRVTFAPHTCRIYARPVRVTLGFGSLRLLAHQTTASYALRVPQARALLTASSPRRLATDAVAVRLAVPVTRVRRGLAPPSHFPARFRLPVISAGSGASRRARRTQEERGRALSRSGPSRVALGRGRYLRPSW